MFCIYCVTNNKNNKKYISYTKESNLNVIKSRHNRLARSHDYNAPQCYCEDIRKFGIDSFNYEVIEYLQSDISTVRNKVYDYIEKFNTFYPNGYNLVSRGGKQTFRRENSRFNADDKNVEIISNNNGPIMSVTFRTLQDVVKWVKFMCNTDENYSDMYMRVVSAIKLHQSVYGYDWKFVSNIS